MSKFFELIFHLWFASPSCLGLDLWFREQFPANGLLIRYSLMNVTLPSHTSRMSRTGFPSIRNPACNELISDSVELWDTDVCFWHIQLRVLPKIRQTFPKSILTPQSHQENLGLGINPIDNAGPSLGHDIVFGSHWCGECMKSNEPHICHKRVHLVTARASLFTEQRMSGPSIWAKYKLFQKICEHTSDNSPTDSSFSSFLNWWSSKQRLETLYSCSIVCQHVLPWQFFSCSSENTLFKHVYKMFNNDFIRFAVTLSASQVYVVKKWS